MKRYRKVSKSSRSKSTIIAMGQQYAHLSYEDRVKIEHWHRSGKSIRYLQGHARVTLKKSNGSEGKEVKLAKDGITGKQTWAILCTFNQLYKNDKHYDVLKRSGCLDSKGNH